MTAAQSTNSYRMVDPNTYMMNSPNEYLLVDGDLPDGYKPGAAILGGENSPKIDVTTKQPKAGGTSGV